MARGIFVSRIEAEKTTLREALERYLKEISSSKKGASIEAIRICYWRNHPLSKRSLAEIRSSDLAAWRDARLSEVSSSTVNRERVRPPAGVRDHWAQDIADAQAVYSFEGGGLGRVAEITLTKS